MNAAIEETLNVDAEEETKNNLFEKYKDQVQFFDFVICPSCNQSCDVSKNSCINLITCDKCKNNFCNSCNKELDKDTDLAKKHYDLSDCYYLFQNFNFINYYI